MTKEQLAEILTPIYSDLDRAVRDVLSGDESGIECVMSRADKLFLMIEEFATSNS